MTRFLLDGVAAAIALVSASAMAGNDWNQPDHDHVDGVAELQRMSGFLVSAHPEFASKPLGDGADCKRYVANSREKLNKRLASERQEASK